MYHHPCKKQTWFKLRPVQSGESVPPLSTGESDSGSGAPPPDEHLPGQTHDHSQWRNVPERWAVQAQHHPPLSHSSEFFWCYPGRGGELVYNMWLCVLMSTVKSTDWSVLHLQVKACASKLNTNDVFVLKTPSGLFVWHGVGASSEEVEAAKHVVGFFGGSPTKVSEGKEPGRFSTEHSDLTQDLKKLRDSDFNKKILFLLSPAAAK